MKIRINKTLLGRLPSLLADRIRSFRDDHRVATFSLDFVDRVTVSEDSRYTAFSGDCGRSIEAGAAGEWAGPSGLRPGATIVIPPGCTVVEEGIFLGRYFLVVSHNRTGAELGALALVTAA